MFLNIRSRRLPLFSFPLCPRPSGNRRVSLSPRRLNAFLYLIAVFTIHFDSFKQILTVPISSLPVSSLPHFFRLGRAHRA